jgi:hypothetical protein
MLNRAPMRALAIILFLGLTMAACGPESDITGSTNASCPARLYSSYDARDIRQCVNACISCDRGTTVTCTTSCTLKGAR